jgi:hypothetical protein
MNLFHYNQDPLYTAAAAILQGQLFESLDESHFKLGDTVTCIQSGMSGKIVKVDEPETGKYYHVKREDGKIVQYSPSELQAVNVDEGSLVETSINTKQAFKEILRVMETQSFADWYEKDFTYYIEGDGKTQQEILDDLETFFTAR